MNFQMKQFCSSLLILLFFVTAISSRDDQVSLAELLLNADPTDDAIVAPSQVPNTDNNCVLPTLLDQLDHAQVAALLAFVPVTTYGISGGQSTSEFCEPYVAVPGERAPPTVLSA